MPGKWRKCQTKMWEEIAKGKSCWRHLFLEMLTVSQGSSPVRSDRDTEWIKTNSHPGEMWSLLENTDHVNQYTPERRREQRGCKRLASLAWSIRKRHHHTKSYRRRGFYQEEKEVEGTSGIFKEIGIEIHDPDKCDHLLEETNSLARHGGNRTNGQQHGWHPHTVSLDCTWVLL